MNEFKSYHPVVNMLYFVLVIGFSCFLMHPVCQLISLISAFIYSVMLKGRKAVRSNLIFMLPMIILTAIMNPLFNHEGVTILFYFPWGNPMTYESLIYGLFASVMIVSVICHFSCYNEIMTSDKFLYLFGKIIPSLSLIISMTFRFVPKFVSQFKVVANTQKCMGRDMSSGNMMMRIKHGLNILSVMTTWSLENAVETADSMKSRGYGLPGRTAFSIFRFDKRDKKALCSILFLGVYTFVGTLSGAVSFEYFPKIQSAFITVYGISVLIAYALLCICPIIIEIREVRRWKA